MLKWVSRRALDGRVLSACALCTEGADVATHPHLRTIDEHITWLLADKESVAADGDVRAILNDGLLVGCVELTDDPPAHISDLKCRSVDQSVGQNRIC